MELSQQETTATIVIRRIEFKKNLQKIAAKLIKNWYKLVQQKKKGEAFVSQSLLFEVVLQIEKFKKERRKIVLLRNRDFGPNVMRTFDQVKYIQNENLYFAALTGYLTLNTRPLKKNQNPTVKKEKKMNEVLKYALSRESMQTLKREARLNSLRKSTFYYDDE